MNNTIGIDISKGKLDAYWLSNHEHRQFCNDRAGVKALALWAQKVGVAQVIFESTGVCPSAGTWWKLPRVFRAVRDPECPTRRVLGSRLGRHARLFDHRGSLNLHRFPSNYFDISPIVLFLLSIRRSGGRVGRIAERFETTEEANKVQRRMLEAAARRPRDRGELVDRLRNGGF